MRTQPSDLRTQEKSQTTAPAYLYIVYFEGSTQYGSGYAYFTNYDRDVSATGAPSPAASPQVFTAAQIQHQAPEQSTELSGRSVDVTLAATDQDLRKYFLTAQTNKIDIEIYRVNTSALPSSIVWGTHVYQVFKGTAERISFADYTVTLSCVSLLFQQDKKIPRFYYQKQCNHMLYGTGCGLNKDLFKINTTVKGINRTSRYIDIQTGSAYVRHYESGFVTMTNGTANGNKIGIVSTQDITVTGLTAVLASGGTLTAGTTYYYKVAAVFPSGEAAPSVEVSATPSGSNLTVNLAWTATADTTSYRVYRTTTAGSYPGSSLIGTPSVASLSDTGLSASSGSPDSTKANTRLRLQWWPFGIAAADTLSVFKGCNRTTGDCTVIFNNLPNFGGTPYVPINNPSVDGIPS